MFRPLYGSRLSAPRAVLKPERKVRGIYGERFAMYGQVITFKAIFIATSVWIIVLKENVHSF